MTGGAATAGGAVSNGKLLAVGAIGAVILIAIVIGFVYSKSDRRVPDVTKVVGSFTAPSPFPSVVSSTAQFTFHLQRYAHYLAQDGRPEEEKLEDYPSASLVFSVQPADALHPFSAWTVSTDATGRASLKGEAFSNQEQVTIHVHADKVRDFKRGREHVFDADSPVFETHVGG